MRLALLFALLAAAPAAAGQASKYEGMSNEIGGLLDDALARYKRGDASGAKSKVETAYFQVFENLEGPIRVNVSAKANYELEEEFTAIRKMIVRREPAPAIESRVADFMTRLRAAVKELEGGVELVAESPSQDEGALETAPGRSQPAWVEALEDIDAGLKSALAAYKSGDRDKAASLVERTQFDHYKNSLLETAIRGGLSQRRNFEHNEGFSGIAAMLRAGEPAAKVEAETAGLLSALREDVPGLPLVPGAKVRKGAAAPQARDWTKAGGELKLAFAEAARRYGRGEADQAVQAVQDAYFDLFEASGLEAAIGARDAAAKAEIEAGFGLVIAKMRGRAPAAELPWAALDGAVERALRPLSKGADSPWAIFLYSLTIILREGIEAILIVTMITAYLIKTGHRDKLRVIYNGCASAVAASALTAFVVKWALRASSASQEALEGATMLLAAAVLFSVSYWLISKLEARKWTAFIHDKIGGSLSSNSLRALWFAAFLAVYREGAETVLFYQALASGSTGAGITAAAGGFAVGCAALAAFFLAMRRGALKVPLKPFFLLTGSMLYLMAVVFAGKGIMELASAKAFVPTLVPGAPTVPLLGLYPYVQTLLPQLALVLAAAVALPNTMRRNSDVH